MDETFPYTRLDLPRSVPVEPEDQSPYCPNDYPMHVGQRTTRVVLADPLLTQQAKPPYILFVSCLLLAKMYENSSVSLVIIRHIQAIEGDTGQVYQHL